MFFCSFKLFAVVGMGGPKPWQVSKPLSRVYVPHALRAIKDGTSSSDAIFGRVQVNISKSENVFENFHHYCL